MGIRLLVHSSPKCFSFVRYLILLSSLPTPIFNIEHHFISALQTVNMKFSIVVATLIGYAQARSISTRDNGSLASGSCVPSRQALKTMVAVRKAGDSVATVTGTIENFTQKPSILGFVGFAEGYDAYIAATASATSEISKLNPNNTCDSAAVGVLVGFYGDNLVGILKASADAKPACESVGVLPEALIELAKGETSFGTFWGAVNSTLNCHELSSLENTFDKSFKESLVTLEAFNATLPPTTPSLNGC